MDDKNVKEPLLRLYYEVINQGRLEVLDEIYHPSYVNHVAPFGLSNDLSGLKELFKLFISAFPDQKIEVDEIYTFGDRVISKWILRATHKGVFLGIEPTDKRVTLTGVDIERINNGKILEHWGVEDVYGLMEQLGSVPQLKA